MIPLAHGLGQAADLPLPLDLVLQAGAATVVVSFLGSALLWRHARLSGGVERPYRSPVLLRLVVLAVALYVVLDALAGPRGPANPAAHALFVWLWVGLIPVSIVAGPVWRAVNPLRTLFRAMRPPVLGRPLPAGEWPAALFLLAFAGFELLLEDRTDPLVIGLVLVGYAVVQLGLATVFGEQWFARGDCFEVYSTLAGRLSPFSWRPWPAGLTADPPPGIGRAAFLAVWWGSTVFDSAAGRIPLPGPVALPLICLVVLVAVRALAGRLDVTGSLIPIAAGYTLAHYLTLLLTEGPRGLLLLVQQWGLAESVTWSVSLPAGLTSTLQVLLILTGHTIGVLVAHDRALTDTPDRPLLATLADELPIVLFMIACTWAGLFLLFVR